MHLLICNTEFDADAEGICTGRLVRALLDAQCKITVVTSSAADTSFQHERLNYVKVDSRTLWPRKAFSLLTRLLNKVPVGADYPWCRRVAALHLSPRPDIIYGRAWPIAGVVAARSLALKLGIPFWMHLSDPYPTPWLEPGSRVFKRLCGHARRLIQDSQAVTFTTPQALGYQQRAISMQLGAKAFVLRHIAPDPTWLPCRRNPAQTTCAYIGSFYGKRTATALLEGFALHLKSSPDSRFLFVGSDPNAILPDAERLGIARAIQLVERVKDVRPYLAAADVLVAVDDFHGEPVFLSTKLVEYMVVNRPVLLISPANSPGAGLAMRFERTMQLVARQDTREIAGALTSVAGLRPDDKDYLSRFEGMNEFSAQAVASQVLHEAEKRGIR